jgi:hypothetical protein
MYPEPRSSSTDQIGAEPNPDLWSQFSSNARSSSRCRYGRSRANARGGSDPAGIRPGLLLPSGTREALGDERNSLLPPRVWPTAGESRSRTSPLIEGCTSDEFQLRPVASPRRSAESPKSGWQATQASARSRVRRAYYLAKQADGKSRKEAMPCLKRRISDAVYRQVRARDQTDGSYVETTTGGSVGSATTAA